MTATVRRRNGDTLGAAFAKRTKVFEDAELAARRVAARTATTTSRRSFKHTRDIIAPRAGRSSTGGRLTSFIEWRADGGDVVLDVNKLDSGARHWIIQEIGTGKRAAIKSGGDPNPVGRPRTGANYVRTIKSQRGRRISGGLVWASPSGKYTPPISGRTANQQLHLASTVTGVPFRAPAIRIQREIKGQHFIQKGAQEGFRQYKSSTLAAARKAFRKGSR